MASPLRIPPWEDGYAAGWEAASWGLPRNPPTHGTWPRGESKRWEAGYDDRKREEKEWSSTDSRRKQSSGR
jgi:hypothetical protein